MNWTILDKFVEIKSPWLTLIGEKIKNNQGKILDYWRIEKADSIIIITTYQNQLIFPQLMFRAGVNQRTLDFAGGRLREGKTIEESALLILNQELGLKADDLNSLEVINQQSWQINSSFSNQNLWGFYAEINPEKKLDQNLIGAIYQLNQIGIKQLLQDLTCLQCRALLLDWIIHNNLIQ